MKLAGFITGAGVAAAGLAVWSALTTVTDAMRLDRMLTACADYATTGAPPFVGEGRSIGVYDVPVFEDDFVADTHRILDDGRFEAAWEQIDDVESPIRLCRVTARFDGGAPMSFRLEGGALIPLVTQILASFGDLVPETDTITDGPRTLGWYEAGKAQDEGIRVVLIAGPSDVSSFFVGADVTP